MQGSNDWNRFTLLEALYGNYISSPPATPPFPNLHSIVIVRQDTKTGQPAKRIPVDLVLPTGAVKCDSDIPLQFGDIVEIPEREHTLEEAGFGLTREELRQIAQCREGTVELVVRGKRTPMKVRPTSLESAIGSVLGRSEARQALFSSSDLSQVKVTRRDSAGGKPREWVIDCSSGKAPDLWLRDGDVVEVPDKQ